MSDSLSPQEIRRLRASLGLPPAPVVRPGSVDLPRALRQRLADARSVEEAADLLGAYLTPGRSGQVPWRVYGTDTDLRWVIRRWVRPIPISEGDLATRYGLPYRDQRAVPEPIESAVETHVRTAAAVGEWLASDPRVRDGLLRVVIIRPPRQETTDASR